MNEKEELYERLKILEQCGLITIYVSEQVKIIIELLFQSKEELDTEKVEIFITHMAMAIQRILKGEYENPLDEEILKDLEKEEVYTKAKIFSEMIYKSVDINFPETEKGYLIVHLCNLFS